MKKLFFSLLLATLIHFVSAQKIEHDKIHVVYHPNVETYFILERLAVQRLGRYGYITKETDNSHQPLVKAAFDIFKAYQDSTIVVKTALLLDSLQKINVYNSAILEVLLYAKPFPATGFIYPVKPPTYLDEEKSRTVLRLIKEYIHDMRNFYVKAEVDSFLKKHQNFYEGAIAEVKKDIPHGIGRIMEDYYGEQVAYLTVIVNPTMPIAPVKGDFRGIGLTVQTKNEKLPYMVLSTSVMLTPDIEILERKRFGYDNPYHTRLLTVHEFGHSFINPHLASHMKIIDQYDHLFTPKLDSIMSSQDQGSWKTCVIEHLVRLGEIRIAETMNDSKLADALRRLHIQEEKHIFIPALEEKIKEYEENRDKYASFTSFIPELLTVFENFTPEKVDEQLSLIEN